MKIQTAATISSISINGEPENLKQEKTIELEFSAIDTGGGFKDPILDFSFSIDDVDFSIPKESIKEIEVELTAPQNKENTIAFSYQVNVQSSENQVNGRLKDEQLSRELIGFVLQLLR
jgi:hypothetical protein